MTHLYTGARWPVSALAAAIAVLAPTVTSAQTQPGTALEEVVVTAQRREGNLQDTPIAISAFTNEKLEVLGVTNVSEIAAYAPNTTIQNTPNTNSGMAVFIRGIGTSETALLTDPKIGIYIDDIYMSKTMGGVFDIVDIERIEVLRGPQGTLFGRNTTGGAISVVTAKPTGEFGIKANASVGNFDTHRTGFSVDLPAVANVAAKLSWMAKETDGWATNEYRGEPLPPADKVSKNLGYEDSEAFRMALRWNATDNLSVDYSYDLTNNKGSSDPFQIVHVKDSLYNGFSTTPFPFEYLGGELYQQMADVVGNPNKRQERFRLDSQTDEWLDVEGHALTVEWQLDEVTLKYIFGHRETAFGYKSADYGGAFTARDAFYGGGAVVGVPEFAAGVDSDIEMTTHELQVFGAGFSDRLNYTLGAFFYDEEVSQSQPQTFTLPILFVAGGSPDLQAAYEALGFCDGGVCTGSQRLPLPFGAPGADPNLNGVSDFNYGQQMDSWAVYGQASYDLTDALTATFGVRYTEEERDVFVFNEDFGHVTQADAVDADEEWDNTSAMFNLTYRFTDDISVYGKFTQGFNGGGYNARAGSPDGFVQPTDEETVNSYELGLKSELLDRRVRLNVALFINDYTDIQITQFEAGTGGASSVIVNAGEGTYQGIEIDLVAIPVEGLTLDLNYGYLDAEFDSYDGVNPVTNQIEDLSDITTVPYAPENTAALGVQYDFPMTGFGEVSARVDFTYKDEVVFHPFQNQYSSADDRTLVNARLSLNSIPLSSGGEHRLDVSLWGKNLTDEEYREFGIDFGSLGWAGALYGDPRTYGIDFRYQFE